MQRLKDFLSGDSQTPPSLNPNHTAKDDLKHAAQDLVHAKDDIKGQLKEKMHHAGQEVRNTADNVEDRAARATHDLRSGARDVRDDLRSGARDLRADARDGARDLRDNVRDGARDLRYDAQQRWGAARENVRDARDEAREDLRDVRDTGRRASRDFDDKVRATGREIDYKTRAAGREIANEADELAYRARVKAHNAKVEIEDDVHAAANAVGNGLRDAKDVVVGSIVLLEDKIENGFDRLSAKAHRAADRARAEARSAERAVEDKVQQVENKVQQVERDVQRRLSYVTFANYTAPWFRDVGYDYDVTFYQPRLVGKRVAITTPNLLGNSVRGAELTVSTVHSSAEAATNEQLASNFRWVGDFFTRRPVVRVETRTTTNGVLAGTRPDAAWEFRRPQRVVLDAYASLPTNGGRPTLRAGATVTDRISRSVFGGSFKLNGNQWLAAYQTRLPYVSLSGALASDAAGDKVALSGGLASTVFSDALRESQINVGVEVKSAKFSTKQSSTPEALASVTAKIEYDEPSWNLDARVRARNYTDQQSAPSLKISDAHVRGLYVWNQGQYPRTALGVTVGVASGPVAADSASAEDDVAQAPGFLPYGDPDRRVASNFLGGLRGAAASSFASGLDAPVVGVSVHHAINPQNRVAFGITSIRGLAASFNYRLRPDISVQTSVSTDLPSWNVLDVAKAGGIGKPQLGISLTIGAI